MNAPLPISSAGFRYAGALHRPNPYFRPSPAATSGRPVLVTRPILARPVLSRSPVPPCTALDIGSRFGHRLRQLRRDNNLTQLRMAKLFGIDRSFISDVERGRKSISLPMLEVIALGMKVSLSDLLKDL